MNSLVNNDPQAYYIILAILIFAMFQLYRYLLFKKVEPIFYELFKNIYFYMIGPISVLTLIIMLAKS